VEDAAEIVETLAPAARMLGGELASRLAAGDINDTESQSIGYREFGTSENSKKPEYRRLLTELGYEPTTLDDLVERTGQPPAELSSMLLMLELEARVESLPGNRYQRLPDGGRRK
jgi:DNA processing protein